jgi:16S rRNA C1402 (ribose-2'-O) methylase RsmI
VLEAARLSDRVHVESVGGPSALGALLMRAESAIEDFAFLGILQSRQDVDRFAPRLARLTAAGLPAVFFGMGAGLKQLLPMLLGCVPELRGRLSLYCDLTSEREMIRHTELPGAAPTSALDDYTRVVVVITPA